METTSKGTHEPGKPTGGTQGAGQGSTGIQGAAQGSTGSAGRPAGQAAGASATQRATEPSGGGQIIDQTKQALSDAYDKTSQTLNATYDQAMDYGRENPGKLTLIAFGAGIGVGLLLAGSFSSRSRTSRIVPPVMNALTEIVQELFS